MFDFNDVILDNNSDNNSDNTINNIQLNLLDIRVVFFNCYKLFIKVEKYNDDEYYITNIVSNKNRNIIKYNEVIRYKNFESLLLAEFTCINISSINKCIEEVYTSKYFKIRTIRIFDDILPAKVLIKFNDNINIQDLIKLSDINDYNNALDDINRPGCLDITTYNKFFDLLPNKLYKIGDNVLDAKFHKFYKTSLNSKQQEYYKNSIFYMDKSNKKFYFIFTHKMLQKLGAVDIVEILCCYAAYSFISNTLFKYERNRSIYKMNGNSNNKISITVSPNLNDVPEYILKMVDCNLKQSSILQRWTIIMVEPY